MSVADARDWFASVKWNTGAPVDMEAMRRVVGSLVDARMLAKDQANDWEARLLPAGG